VVEEQDALPQWLAIGGMATVGFTAVRVAGSTISDYLFLAATGIIALRLLAGRRANVAPITSRRTSPTLLLGLGILTAGGLLATMLRSYDPAGSAFVLVRLWYITIIWFWVVRSVSTSFRTFERLVLAAIVGTIIHSLIGVYQDVSGANMVYPYWGRSQGLSDHFHDLAVSIGSLLPVLVMWPASRNGGTRKQLLKIAAILITFAGIGTTGAMTALGSVLIGIAVALLAPRLVGSGTGGRRSLVLPASAAVVVLLTIATGLVDLPVMSRLTELTEGTNAQVTGSAVGRIEMAEIAIDGAVRSPIVGVGLDNISGEAANTFNDMKSADSEQQLQIHSFYLRILFEAGIFGLLGVLLMLFVFFRQVIQLLQITRNTTLSWLPAGLLGGLVMLCVDGMFGPYLFARYFWLPMALISGLYGLVKTRGLAGIEPLPRRRTTRAPMLLPPMESVPRRART